MFVILEQLGERIGAVEETFVGGIYGMNLDPSAGTWNTPELSWPFGFRRFSGSWESSQFSR